MQRLVKADSTKSFAATYTNANGTHLLHPVAHTLLTCNIYGEQEG